MFDQFPILLFLAVLGLCAGNFATTFIYRLPRRLPITRNPPYCECERRVMLEVRDNFPLASWLINRGKCRFCSVAIPTLYPTVEVLCALLFVAGYLRYGMGEELVLALALGVVLIVLAAIYYTHGMLIPSVLILAAAIGAVHRTLLDGTIYDFSRAGFFGLLAGLAVWGLQAVALRQKLNFPAYVPMLAVGALCVGTANALPFFALAAALTVLLYTLGALGKNASLRRAAPVFGIVISLLWVEVGGGVTLVLPGLP